MRLESLLGIKAGYVTYQLKISSINLLESDIQLPDEFFMTKYQLFDHLITHRLTFSSLQDKTTTPPDFDRLVNSISTKEGSILCPPHCYIYPEFSDLLTVQFCAEICVCKCAKLLLILHIHSPIGLANQSQKLNSEYGFLIGQPAANIWR